jgi:hypothetical protein
LTKLQDIRLIVCEYYSMIDNKNVLPTKN